MYAPDAAPLGHRPTFADLKAKLVQIYSTISSFPSLEPCAEVNEAFGSLIAMITFPYDNAQTLSVAVAADPDLISLAPHLIRLCSDAESHLESHWTSRLLASAPCPISSWIPFASRRPQPISLEPFVYLENYRALVKLEHGLLVAVGAKVDQVLFIGSGPLPLSSLLLGREHLATQPGGAGWKITSVDSESTALRAGADLVAAALGTTLSPSSTSPTTLETKFGPGTFAFLPQSATDLPPATLAGASVVVLAALVGLTREAKVEVALHLIRSMAVGAHLLLRSAEGLRALAYPAGAEEEIVARARDAGTPVELVVVAHPKNQVVNSVIILRRME